MSTINLADQKEVKSYASFFNGGMINAFLILLVACLVYGGLVYMNKKVVAETQDVHAQYMGEYGKFLTGKANGIIDFKNRSVIAGNLLDKSFFMRDVFSHIEASILPSVYLSKMNYNNKTKVISLSCITDSLDSESRQLLSFQSNEYFSSLSLDKSAIDAKTGLMSFDVSLKIK